MSPFEKVFVALLVHGGGFVAVCIIMLALQWAGNALCRMRGMMTLSGRRKARKYSSWYFGTNDVYFCVKGRFAQLGQAVITFDSEGEVLTLPSDQCKQTTILKSL